MGKKYVDVNVFVYWLAGHPEHGVKAREWVRRMEHGRRGEYVTSALTLYELTVILAGLTGRSLRDGELARTVVDAVSGLPGLEAEPLVLEDYVRALELMLEYRLDYEDSIHLAVALRSKARTIISNDRDFDNAPLKRAF